MSDVDVDPARPQRWWRKPIDARLSVRGLMVLVLLVAGGLDWFIKSARVQRDAVAAIGRGGGKVYYDIAHPAFRFLGPGRSPWPRELLLLLGPDYFGNVTRVDVGPANIDAVLAHVGRLGRLSQLQILPGGRPTAAGFAHLRRLTGLTDLAIPDTLIDGSGFAHLRRLTRLRQLGLGATRLADADLVVLENMPALEGLTLSSPRITDAGLVHMKDLVSLRRLELSAPVTSAGLAHLRRLSKLETLVLNATRVADLAPLRQFAGLTYLALGHTPLDDSGLAPVAGLAGLQRLYLNDTRVTDAGLKSLRGLSALLQLDLAGTRVGDAGMPDLAGLSRLNSLSLARTRVTDAGLADVDRLPTLLNLDLSRTRVTDAGLMHLNRKGPVSRTINLKGTGVTPAGAAAIKTRLGSSEIIH